jgi:hypothetical protein
VAELPVAADVGLHCHQHLFDRQRDIPLPADDSGHGGRARQVDGWRKKVYRILALGWRGTEREWVRLEKAISIMALIIIPVAVSVHTIVSWDFAMTLMPMWRSTIFGPYFVVGAIFSGIAALLIAMVLIRKYFKLEHVPAADPFRQSAQDALRDEPAVVLLHVHRIPRDVVRQRSARDAGVLVEDFRPLRAALLADGGLQLHHPVPDSRDQEAADDSAHLLRVRLHSRGMWLERSSSSCRR